MVFSSGVFLFLFLPVTLAVYYSPLCKKLSFRNVWLLFVSLGFYAWGEPVYVFLMILSIVMNYLFGRIAEVHSNTVKGKCIVALSCIYNLGMLFVFKYLGWIAGLCGVSAESGIRQIALPIGISFYTFQALSYVIDIYRGQEKAQKNILDVGLYIAFFPQLIAGPIVRYGTIAEQLKERVHNFDLFSEGVWRFIIGLSKKLLLANNVAVVAEQAFARDGAELSVGFAWAGALAFMLQIYFDFSGYSDMAIGLGKMFGFEFMENFNYPYISKSIAEFWRRWHISLGAWFRDYLFYPLSIKLARRSGNKRSKALWGAFVLFVVWFATGVWHGANVTFIVWGLIQFVFILWEKHRKHLHNKSLGKILGFVSTFFIVLFSFVMFNASSVAHAARFYSSMLHLNGNDWMDVVGSYWIGQYKVFMLIGLIFMFPVVEGIKGLVEKRGKIICKGFNVMQGIVMTVLLFLDICYAIGSGYNPFIYFNF